MFDAINPDATRLRDIDAANLGVFDRQRLESVPDFKASLDKGRVTAEMISEVLLFRRGVLAATVEGFEQDEADGQQGRATQERARARRELFDQVRINVLEQRLCFGSPGPTERARSIACLEFLKSLRRVTDDPDDLEYKRDERDTRDADERRDAYRKKVTPWFDDVLAEIAPDVHAAIYSDDDLSSLVPRSDRRWMQRSSQFGRVLLGERAYWMQRLTLLERQLGPRFLSGDRTFRCGKVREWMLEYREHRSRPPMRV